MKFFYCILLISVFSVFHSFGQVQTIVKEESELLQISEKEIVKTDKPEKGIVVLSSQNGQKTLLITDSELRREIFNNSEKRDMLTALPGFVSLGTLENGLRVTIKNEYINKYLLEHLGVKEADLSNIK
ncbi:MAG: hypothetical protein M3Q58_00045 [Bacteroidota bacterium]|nr:hypothetical protein [Bacteroidota bacterium]